MMQTPNNLNRECILVPQTIDVFSVRIKTSDGKEYVYTAPKALTFASGTFSTLTLKVGRNRVTSGEFTANAWQTSNNTGNMETE